MGEGGVGEGCLKRVQKHIINQRNRGREAI